MKKMGFLCIFLLFIFISYNVSAEESRRSASIMDIKGIVEVKATQGEWEKAKIGMTLEQGYIIRTKKKSRALLNVDGMGQTATVEIKQNSQMQLMELLENKEESSQATLLDLAIGEILIKAQKLHSPKSKFEVKTPTSIVGVRGTTFSVSVGAEE
jgi:hypothetical protein